MTARTCSRCGRRIDGDEPHGLCPSCLLQQALFEETLDRTEQPCPSCSFPLAYDARFCAHCGTAAPATSQSPDDPLRHSLEAKLGGQYRILRLLGRGGMGAVYLARDLTLEREVAIKVIKPAADGAGMYDRFRREAKTAAKLSHPNIVPLHAFGEVDGMPYFVMGYVRGESLAERLRRDGRLSEEETRRILAEIADALDHAHRQGVVHRDVKPDNVLLEDASGRALLTDFGIAKMMTRTETLTRHGAVVGTPHYMSPEQAAGRADCRSDVYSLGVMAYAMLAGRLPFDGSAAADVLAKHLTQEPPPLRSLVPSISNSTLQTIERCLAKDPANRWQDSRSLKMALGESAEGDLPDALQAVQGQGLTYFLSGAAFVLLAWYVVVRQQHAPMSVLGVISGAILAGYIATSAKLRLEGFPIGLIQRVFWSEPVWWQFWYPRALRRRNNVWDRLPRPVRLGRSVVPLILVLFAATTIENLEDNEPVKLLISAMLLVIAWIVELIVMRQLKRMGVVSSNDRYRIAFSTPVSRASFWRQPHVAAILTPMAGETVRRTDSPHDHLRSILRVADDLSGPLRPVGAEAATAARRLIASIESFDRQIADLARNLEPGEEGRLAEKIEALEESPMRALIEQQLELIRGLTARIEDAKASRNRHIEMLKTLALHLASLRARVADTPSQVGSLSDNVRALCDHISRQGNDLPTVEQS